MNVLKLLLYPFAVLYDLITRVRNYLFDIGHKRSFEFDTNVIGVGNLSVGGAGKTPMVEYLVRLLKANYSLATLSRGYKRETSGFRFAGASDSARTLGDEPFQLYRKFGEEVRVVVAEDRAFAIPNILQESPTTDIIILDDAFQHRSVKPQLMILVTDSSRPFFADYVVPYGRLREARIGARRADLVVITKCEDSIDDRSEKLLVSKVQKFAGAKPVFFTSIQYQLPVSFGNSKNIESCVVLVTGIAETGALRDYCSSHYKVLRHFEFEDHHRFTVSELKEIESFCQGLADSYSIITTEKDMVRLMEPSWRSWLDRMPWFYLPIEQVFLKDGLKFDELVLASLKEPAKN
jgi:tetraacyldisaccharide 4'-kinase